MTEPADNRWPTTYPIGQDTLLMHGFHQLLPYVEHYCNARGPDKSKPEERMHVTFDDVFVKQDFEKTRSAWNRRAAKFIHSVDCQVRLYLCLVIMAPMMQLYYTSF